MKNSKSEKIKLISKVVKPKIKEDFLSIGNKNNQFLSDIKYISLIKRI